MYCIGMERRTLFTSFGSILGIELIKLSKCRPIKSPPSQRVLTYSIRVCVAKKTRKSCSRRLALRMLNQLCFLHSQTCHAIFVAQRPVPWATELLTGDLPIVVAILRIHGRWGIPELHRQKNGEKRVVLNRGCSVIKLKN